MYSDEWQKKGYRFETRIPVSNSIYYKHVYDENDTIVGVIIDFEYADDFHYELMANDWQKFCIKYLEAGDERLAFQQFIEKSNMTFALENALEQANIPFKKIAFY